MTDKPTCIIYSMFDFKSEINATYDPADEGLSENFTITGSIWNTGDHRFLDKECHVTFSKGHNKRLDKFAKAEGFEEKVCGGIRIFKNVEPDKFDVDGTEFQEPPLKLTIWLLENDFYAIERVCKNSIDKDSKINGSFDIFSKEFCEKGFRFPNIDQLDVSTTKKYIITSFSLQRSIYKIVPKSKRTILSPDRKIDSPRTSIDILINNTQFKIQMPYGYLDYIQLSGKISNRIDSKINGLECSLQLKEYEIDSDGEYPEKNFAGKLFYFQGDDSYIDLELKYKKSDVENFIKYFINSSSNSSIVVTSDLGIIHHIRHDFLDTILNRRRSNLNLKYFSRRDICA